MNIWGWVHSSKYELRAAGHERLAELIEKLPNAVTSGRQVEVLAMSEEALSLARPLKLTWIEVFIRHWRAQSQILLHQDVSQGLVEVVSLLELAHRPENIECPQSVCVTQDICVAYATMDGPGYAAERLAAATETLSRINVNWPCFGCIGSEKADALNDVGQYHQAEQFCVQHRKELSKAGKRSYAVESAHSHSLRMQGQYEKALLKIAKAPDAVSGTASMFGWHQQRSELLALLGRWDAALAEHQAIENLVPSGYLRWARTWALLCSHDATLNSATNAKALRDCHDLLKKNGAMFDQGGLAVIGARLAALRNDQFSQSYFEQELALVKPQLRQADQLDRFLN